tara:strand:+ start:578 stop:823 length:246 start_codon:yes stop_codon:yes gene_type:complete
MTEFHLDTPTASAEEAAQIVDALHATEAFTLSAIEYTLRRAKPQTPNPPAHRLWKPERIERPIKKDEVLANIRSLRKGQYE